MSDPFADLPRGHFGAIYADPPWHFETWGEGGNRNVTSKYSTMSIEEMCALPVGDLATEDCVLFVWAVWPKLFEAIKVIEAWGFTYRTCGFCWIKADDRQPDMFTDSVPVQVGMGYWTRANSEVCLLAARGKPKRLNADVRQGIIEPRRQHSRKPDCAHGRIERLVAGPLSRIVRPPAAPRLDLMGKPSRQIRGGRSMKRTITARERDLMAKHRLRPGTLHKLAEIAARQGLGR